MAAIAYIKTDYKRYDGSIEYPFELAGQSIECPHCHHLSTLPTPFTPPAAPSVSPPPLQEHSVPQDDDIIYREAGIFVSRTLFVVNSQTFALANISSVREVESSPSRAAHVIFLFLGLGLLAASVFLGIVVIIACIARMCFQKSTFSVVLTAAGGEVNAYSS